MVASCWIFLYELRSSFNVDNLIALAGCHEISFWNTLWQMCRRNYFLELCILRWCIVNKTTLTIRH